MQSTLDSPTEASAWSSEIPVSMLPQEDVELEIDPDPELEQEAEETAQRVMQGGELGIHRMSDTDVHVQRASDTGGHDNIPEAVEVGYYDGDSEPIEADKGELMERSKSAGLEGGKELLKRFVPNEVIAAYEGWQDKKEEQNEQTIEQKVVDMGFPEQWMSDLNRMDPPPAWEAKLGSDSGQGGDDIAQTSEDDKPESVPEKEGE